VYTSLVRASVSSTYVQNGSCTRKQLKSLPTGTNPAPRAVWLADTHCCDKARVSFRGCFCPLLV